MKNLVLLYGASLHVGGTDTLLVRMANAAVSHNKVIVNSDPGPLAQLLDPRVEVTRVSSFREFFKFLKKETIGPLDILVFDPHLLLRFTVYVALIANQRRVKVIYGIFHPRELFPDEQPDWMHRWMEIIFLHTNPRSWLFMNIACRESHARRFGRNLDAYPISPILVNHPPEPIWASKSAVNSLNIVSVGRIVSFKAYNWGVMDMISQLRAAGIDATWTIFGDGDDLESLRRLVELKGMSQSIRFNGVLLYESFDAEIVNYDIFVGMGTALLEAAGLGVPSLIAIDGSLDSTYGFLHNGPSDSIGERISQAKEYTIVDCIIEYAALSPDERNKLGAKCHRRAKSLSSSQLDLPQIFSIAKPWNLRENIAPMFFSLLFILFTSLRRVARFVRRAAPLDPYY